jgi:hypothetical protein
MLFHECPRCNFRCNCSDNPCNCDCGESMSQPEEQ